MESAIAGVLGVDPGQVSVTSLASATATGRRLLASSGLLVAYEVELGAEEAGGSAQLRETIGDGRALARAVEENLEGVGLEVVVQQAVVVDIRDQQEATTATATTTRASGTAGRTAGTAPSVGPQPRETPAPALGRVILEAESEGLLLGVGVVVVLGALATCTIFLCRGPTAVRHEHNYQIHPVATPLYDRGDTHTWSELAHRPRLSGQEEEVHGSTPGPPDGSTPGQPGWLACCSSAGDKGRPVYNVLPHDPYERRDRVLA